MDVDVVVDPDLSFLFAGVQNRSVGNRRKRVKDPLSLDQFAMRESISRDRKGLR